MSGLRTGALRRAARDGRAREFATFVVLGLLSALVHYGTLVGLVEGAGAGPVPASLVGYVAGGIVSYTLNRSLTFRSERPHAEATWRFVAVAAVGFGLTWMILSALHHGLALPYLPAQVATTGIVLFWSYGANKLWTFRRSPVPPVA